MFNFNFNFNFSGRSQEEEEFSLDRIEDHGITLTDKQKEALNLFESKKEILLQGGSRSGKTVISLLYIIEQSLKYPNNRILILRQNFTDLIKSILEDSFNRFLKPKLELEYNQKKNSPAQLTFKNGSSIVLGGISKKRGDSGFDGILGSEYSIIYLNEASEMIYKVKNVLMTRLQHKTIPVKFIIDCNPPSKNHWLYKYFHLQVSPDDGLPLKQKTIDNMGFIKMNPDDNKENLGEDYIETLNSIGGNFSKRFVLGEFSDNNETSIFKEQWFKFNNDVNILEPKLFDYISIGVDPATKDGQQNDETGIVISGLKKEDNKYIYYVLEDLSGRYTPEKMAHIIISAYERYQPKIRKFLVLEVNQGGDFLLIPIRQALKDKGVDSKLNIERDINKEHTKEDKFTRAYVISTLYEKGLVVHCGPSLRELENQMNAMGIDEYLEHDDRVDALMHSLKGLYKLTVKKDDPFKYLNKKSLTKI